MAAPVEAVTIPRVLQLLETLIKKTCPLPDDLRGIKLITAVPFVDADASQDRHRLTVFQLKA